MAVWGSTIFQAGTTRVTTRTITEIGMSTLKTRHLEIMETSRDRITRGEFQASLPLRPEQASRPALGEPPR